MDKEKNTDKTFTQVYKEYIKCCDGRSNRNDLLQKYSVETGIKKGVDRVLESMEMLDRQNENYK